MDAHPTAADLFGAHPYETLVAEIKDFAIILLDRAGVIVSWNTGAERIFDYAAADAVGHAFALIFTPADVQRGIPEQELQKAATTGRADDVRWHERRDGTRFFANGVTTALYDEAGDLRGFVKVARDDTTRKLLEDDLREQRETLETVNHVGQLLTAELDQQKLVQAVTDAATQITGAHFGSFFYNLIDERGESYMLYTLSGVPREAFAHFPMPRNTDIFNPTFQGEGTLLLADVKQDPRYGKNSPYYGMPEGHLPVTSYLAVPVTSRSGEVIGGLFFGHPEAGVFTERAAHIVEGLAAQTAIAMDNARLFDAARRERTALYERTRLAELNADIGQALTMGDSLADMLHRCAAAMVEQLDAAFARIWTLNQQADVLELQASAGMYTHLDGPHGRVPVGQYKIGRIAAERQPHLTNEVVGDPQVSDQAWAAREGMVAFAGYPLIVADRLLGVVAMFARKPLTGATLQALAAAANAIALGIERKRGEEERAQLLSSEQHARQEAEAANRTKDEFLSTLSHELRTPLTAILGWTRMLSAGQIDEANRQRALETIERNAHMQQQLIEDILDVSRVISGKMRLEVRPLDLTAVIEAAVDAVLPAAAAKEIRMQRVLDSGASMVSGDPARLQQVIWNLLTNAIKFTPKGGRVHVRLERVNSHVEIIVSDSGQGIAADVLPFVFERFRQADSTSTRAHGGLGLGLAIVRHLVEMHGGTVEAESAGAGAGATFTVKLPLIAMRAVELAPEQAQARVHPTAREHVPFHCPPELAGLHILVVDDEADTRDLVTAVLERCAARVTATSSVAEAFALLKELRPDVLISDLGMPEEDGYALISQVRALPAHAGGRTPAVALTAYARMEDRLRVLRAGFQTHLPKPVEPAELVAVVANLTGRIT